MKTVILKSDTVSMVQSNSTWYVRFTYEVFDDKNGLFEVHTINRSIDQNLDNMFTLDLQEIAQNYCVILQESLNAEYQ